LEVLRGWAETIEYHGGIVAENFTLIDVGTKADGTTMNIADRKEIARDRTLAIMYITRADPTRYGTLIADLSNNYAMGKDEYPKDLSAAYSLLVNYKTPTNARTRETIAPAQTTVNTHVPIIGSTVGTTGGSVAASTIATQAKPESSAMTFAQKADMKPGKDGITHEGVKYYNCQATGHFAGDCPSGANTGTTLVQQAFVLAQAKAKMMPDIDPTWILLDSQSTILVLRTQTC
jgi:hypothetical protein